MSKALNSSDFNIIDQLRVLQGYYVVLAGELDQVDEDKRCLMIMKEKYRGCNPTVWARSMSLIDVSRKRIIADMRHIKSQMDKVNSLKNGINETISKLSKRVEVSVQKIGLPVVRTDSKIIANKDICYVEPGCISGNRGVSLPSWHQDTIGSSVTTRK